MAVLLRLNMLAAEETNTSRGPELTQGSRDGLSPPPHVQRQTVELPGKMAEMWSTQKLKTSLLQRDKNLQHFHSFLCAALNTAIHSNQWGCGLLTQLRMFCKVTTEQPGKQQACIKSCFAKHPFHVCCSEASVFPRLKGITFLSRALITQAPSRTSFETIRD